MARSSYEAAARIPRAAAGLDSLLLTGPFHTALRAAIRERGLTLDRLRWHLAQRGIRIGLSTLSLWQHGHSRPERDSSLKAVRALEDVLGLPPTICGVTGGGSSGPARAAAGAATPRSSAPTTTA